MARAYFPLFFDQYISLVTNLDDEETGRLFRAMLYYAKDGLELGLGTKESVVWPMIQRDIDNSKKAYLARCAINAANGKKGADKRWAQEADDSQRHQMPANHYQAEEVKEAEEYKAKEAKEANETKKSSLQTEESNQKKQTGEAVRTESGRLSGEAKQAGPVDVGEKPVRELSFEEKKKRAMAMLIDDHIREQREKMGIRLPEHLRD